jgi:VanZ family protein
MAAHPSPISRLSLLWAILAIAVLAAIFWASSQPNPSFSSSETLDTLIKKGGHLAGYGLLAALAWLAVRVVLRPRLAVVAAFALATGYGVFDELHQAFTATRSPSPVDVGIDATGAALGLLAVTWLVRRRERRPR